MVMSSQTTTKKKSSSSWSLSYPHQAGSSSSSLDPIDSPRFASDGLKESHPWKASTKRKASPPSDDHVSFRYRHFLPFPLPCGALPPLHHCLRFPMPYHYHYLLLPFDVRLAARHPWAHGRDNIWWQSAARRCVNQIDPSTADALIWRADDGEHTVDPHTKTTVVADSFPTLPPLPSSLPFPVPPAPFFPPAQCWVFFATAASSPPPPPPLSLVRWSGDERSRGTNRSPPPPRHGGTTFPNSFAVDDPLPIPMSALSLSLLPPATLHPYGNRGLRFFGEGVACHGWK